MAMDLNINMGSVIKGFMDKQGFSSGMGGSSPIEAYKVAISIFTAAIVVTGAYISLVYLPMKASNLKKTEELNKIIEMKGQLSVLDTQIATLKKKLDKSKEEYLESLAHFGNSEDLGALYQTVSTLAEKYGLVVLNVKEIAPPVVKAKPVKAEKTDEKKKEGEKKDEKKEGEKKEEVKAAESKPGTAAVKKDVVAVPNKSGLDVKEIKVDVEIKGHYGEYIKFKEDLALAEILLKINSESIMVKDEKTEQGSVYVKLNLSTYAIDKKPFQGIITEKENENTN